eukprot:GEMP01032786.1.p1 GENE.GEMP01032786.1~~GEMP01032786.1.p1  ORF type:complete len:383 (+),score=40.13 GEMP01032786.1:541-1689(+)
MASQSGQTLNEHQFASAQPHLETTPESEKKTWRQVLREEQIVAGSGALPDEWDWIARGAVNIPQDQGGCGACWAFASIGALEGAYKIRTGQLEDFSEQWLLDCDISNRRCVSGQPSKAFTWVKRYGICLEKDFPYKCKEPTTAVCQLSTCPRNCFLVIQPNDVVGHLSLKAESRSLYLALMFGPTVVALNTQSVAFKMYTGGVFQKHLCGRLVVDHAVLAIGYGKDAATNEGYWLVKNTWGLRWGEIGLMRLYRETGPNEPEANTCGILNDITVPKLVNNFVLPVRPSNSPKRQPVKNERPNWMPSFAHTTTIAPLTSSSHSSSGSIASESGVELFYSHSGVSRHSSWAHGSGPNMSWQIKPRNLMTSDREASTRMENVLLI